jgi:hypothetical protein
MYLTSSIRAMTDTNSAITLRESTVTHRPPIRGLAASPRPAEEKPGTTVRRAFHYSGRDSRTTRPVVFLVLCHRRAETSATLRLVIW